jgi:hypothetical protein
VSARACPVSTSCGSIEGWERFLAHIYVTHTDTTDPEDERHRQVQMILEGRSRPATVVPKVTAEPMTHALWALAHGDRARAREIIGSLGASERGAYVAQLTELINMLWGEGR